MPIWSQPEDDTRPRQQKVAFVGAATIHFAISPNPKTKYRDADGKPIQHDRAFVTDMPCVPADIFKKLIQEAMEVGHQAAIMPPGHTHDEIAAILAEATMSEKGGTTGTLVFYDPKTFTLEIGSKGDSPAFVIFDDGNKVAVVRVTSGEDSYLGMMSNSLNDPISIKPIREGTYELEGKLHKGTIDMRQLINEAIQVHGLNPHSLKTHLLIASDGILKPSAIANPKASDEEAKALEYYLASKQGRNKNRARNMLQAAIDGGSKDNLSVIFVEDIKQGKGQPIAAAVCDGYYAHGHIVAQRAMEAMEAVIIRTIERFNSNIMSAKYRTSFDASRARGD